MISLKWGRASDRARPTLAATARRGNVDADRVAGGLCATYRIIAFRMYLSGLGIRLH